ncbi:MAG TPA: hypothetical protein VE990_11570 [Acidimicrobiales bacterium]|nr:hypothetical protein [Acidimicrobiales bacterium]
MSVLCTVLAFVLPGSLYESGTIRYVRLAGVLGVSTLAIAASVWRTQLVRTQSDLAAQQRGAERGRRDALELNDAVLQELFTARTWLGLGHEAEAIESLDKALGSTRGLVSDLLGEGAVRPGELVRSQIDLRGDPASAQQGSEGGAPTAAAGA